MDVKRWFDRNEMVRAEYRDTNGDCRTDLWSYYVDKRLVRRGQDREGRGRPDVLVLFDRRGRPEIQEATSGANASPDRRVFFGPNGDVSIQCVDSNASGASDTRAEFEAGQLVRVLIDTRGDGVADQREIHRDGQLVRLEADTNGDRKPDVIQHFRDGQAVRQDEDTDFDGRIDRRFEEQKLVALDETPEIPDGRFGELDCGTFHAFWTRR